jgi:hypothetical protein
MRATLSGNQHRRHVRARTALTAVAFPLNLPATASSTCAANINTVFPHHASDHTAALEDSHIRHTTALDELRCGTIHALAEDFL